MDPSRTASGNQMMGENSRSSRLAVGEAAVRMTKISTNVKNGADVCLTSQRGMDLPSDEEWLEEFSRAQEALNKNMNGELFSASFGSVKSLERLSDWLATKWAPAVLKTYDIAGIRVGARPVYASRIGENQVEIVWQELKDFKTTVVGKMIIEVFDNGVIARRAAGDAKSGYGSISSKPLAGEDILVRRLAEAVTQAVEKGLATKVSKRSLLGFAGDIPYLYCFFHSGRILIRTISLSIACTDQETKEANRGNTCRHYSGFNGSGRAVSKSRNSQYCCI